MKCYKTRPDPNGTRVAKVAWLEERERGAILAACGGIQAQAARQLGISERSLWHRVKKLDIKMERIWRD